MLRWLAVRDVRPLDMPSLAAGEVRPALTVKRESRRQQQERCKLVKGLGFVLVCLIPAAYIAYLWYPWPCDSYLNGPPFYTACDYTSFLRVGVTVYCAVLIIGILFSWRAHRSK